MKRKLFYLSIILVFLVSTLPSIIPAAASDDGGVVYNLPDFEIPEPGNPRLDSRLNQLVTAPIPRGDVSLAETMGIDLVDGNVRVIVECQPGQIDAVARAAGDLANIETSYRDMLQLTVPVSQLTALADMPGVRVVRVPSKPVLFDVVSEGVGLINADTWQTAGYTGEGIKIGVLDIGFAGYEAAQASGDLPPTVTTNSFFDLFDDDIEAVTNHGTACAEVVHDIAPDADLYLVNYGTPVEMGNAVNWLIIDMGVDIITNSTGYPTYGPGDGTGFLCSIVNAAHDEGVLWSQAMGNCAQNHWMGPFVDTLNDDWHEFEPGPNEVNAIFANAGEFIVVGLRWDDPWGDAVNDYNLYLFYLIDDNLNMVWGSENPQSEGYPDPEEFFVFEAPETGYYYIAIYSWVSDESANFHLHSFYHELLWYQTAAGSFVMPADSPHATSVGAVPWDDPTTIEPFSSRGPTDGGLTKPDLVAPDGVTSATYNPFFGTSASTPHTAGAAALVMQAYPALNHDQVKGYLKDNAIELGSPDPNNIFGSGRLNLPNAPAEGEPYLRFTGTAVMTDATGPQMCTGIDAYAYTQLVWSGCGVPTSGTCAEENTTFFNGIDNITFDAGDFVLNLFQCINDNNGDRRIYTDGLVIIGLEGGSDVLSLQDTRFSVNSDYIEETMSASGWATINEGLSDADLVSELDPYGTGQLEFTFSAMGPVIQEECGVYDFDLTLTPSLYSENIQSQCIDAVGVCDFPAAGVSLNVSSFTPGGPGNDQCGFMANHIMTNPGGTPPPGIDSILTDCYWELGTVLAAITADVTFDLAGMAGIDTPENLRILKRHGPSDPLEVYPVQELVDGTHIRANGVSDFSEFAIGVAAETDGSISGTVYEADGETAIEGATVSAYAHDPLFPWIQTWAPNGEDTTDGSGQYNITGLPAGDYKVAAVAADHERIWHQDAQLMSQATALMLAEGQDIGNIDFSLGPGGTISGNVTDQDTLLPIENISVIAGPFGVVELASLALTDENGEYILDGLPYGDYGVSSPFTLIPGSGADNYIIEGWQEKLVGELGDIVNVADGDNPTGIDFTLEAGGVISGYVRTEVGAAIPNALVFVFEYDSLFGGPWVVRGYGWTDANGDYQTTGLPDGTYAVRVIADGYATEWWDNTYYKDLTTPIVITGLGVITGKNFSLADGGSISGHVQDATGDAIVGHHVQAFDTANNRWINGADTDVSGDYTIPGLPAGTYYVKTCAHCSGLNYINEYYNNVLLQQDAQPVTVTPPGATPNIDFALGAGGSISGHIQDAAGDPIFNMHVQAFDSADNRWVSCANTDIAGDYVIIGLPEGSYYVRTCACCVGLSYTDEYYDNVYGQNDATAVPVSVGSDTPNIHFVLDAIVVRPDVETAIADGLAWLAGEQNPDGYWGTYYQVTKTALAVLKLIKYAGEIGIHPLHEEYAYSGNITAGLDYLFSRAFTIGINTQLAGEPDTNQNGLGVYFYSPSYPEGSHHPFHTYESAIALMALAADSSLASLEVDVPGSPVHGWTLAQVVQDTVDYLAWGQTDSGSGRGGWNYEASNNVGPRSDQSNTGWVTMGLMYAEDFGAVIPIFVINELDAWIDYIQADDDGGSYYSGPGDGMTPLTNILRTGNLLQQMAFVGDDITTSVRAQNAAAYMLTYWNDNTGRGWQGCPSNYQATYTAMKGLEQMGIPMLDTIDWFQELVDDIMSQQGADGGWPVSWFDDGDRILSTAWALLTLEKEIPETQELPDLIILDKHEEWVVEGESYTVHFTVKNQGNEATETGFDVVIEIDGAPLPPVSIATLGPDETAIGQSDTIALMGVTDNITVCADTGGVIDERYEDNNCWTNTWPMPDLVISEKYEEWVEEGESYVVHFTIMNDGDAIVPSGHDVMFTAGTGHMEFMEVPVNLDPGASWNSNFGTVIDMTGSMDTVIVFADFWGEVNELDEWNNTRFNTISWPEAPDLTIPEVHEEWEGESYRVYFTIYNQGNALADPGHDASLTVDGGFIESHEVQVTLAPGASYSGNFTTPITVSGDWDTVMVCADMNEEVEESVEFLNCRFGTVALPAAPDLVTFIVNENWIDQDTYTVTAFVSNNGNAEAPAGFDVSLAINGVLTEVLPVPVDMPPGQVRLVFFTTQINLHGSPDEITVCADINQEVDEPREDNNCMTVELPLPPPDLIISDKHEVWVPEQEGVNYTIHFTVQNVGQGIARAGHSVRYFIDFGDFQPETVVVPVELGPGESWSGSFDTVVELSDGLDTVAIFADFPGMIYESNELNNVRINDISWPEMPNLTIADMREDWVDDGVYIVHFTIRNDGNGTADAGHTASLTVDGQLIDTYGVQALLIPGQTFSGNFTSPNTVSGGWDTVMVCADVNGEVEESAEFDNCRTDTIAWPPKPDLEVILKSEQWVEEGTTYRVTAFVRNNGNAAAPAGTDVSLTVDGELIATLELMWPMLPGMTQVVFFPDFQEPPITLSGLYDEITICADVNQEVAESREDNNCTTNYWPEEPGVAVSVNAPATVLEDTDFTATIEITEVTDFNAAQYDILFDPEVLELVSITDGVIGGTVIPIPNADTTPQELAPGHWRIVQSLGTSSVTGTGFLSVLHFHVIGSPGDASDIDITEGVLSSIGAVEIPAIWTGDHVVVSVLYGDANGDGVINVLDMTWVARIILELEPPNPAANANRDGAINVVDMTHIAKIILGLVPTGTLRVAIADFGNESMDPIQQESRWGWSMYDPLITYDSEGNLIGAVAESWTLSPDGNTWTFTIRPGITFHNGDPLTSADVLFSVERFISEDSTNPWSPALRDNFASHEILGPYTYVYHTVTSEPQLAVTFTQVRILPKNYIEANGVEFFRAHPVGSGPWKFVEHVPGTSMEMEANTEHWRQVPAFERVIEYQVPQEATRSAMLEAGMVDIITGLSIDGSVYLQDEGYTLQAVGLDTLANISFPGTWVTDGPTSDIGVRRAMSYAINRQEVCDTFYQGFAEPGGRWFMDEHSWGWDPTWQPDPYDPVEAAALLDAAGYPGAFVDPVITLFATTGPAHDLMQELQGYWDAAGIQVDIQIVDLSVFFSMIFTRNEDPGAPHIGAIWPWMGGSTFNNMYHSANMYRSDGVHTTSNDTTADFLYNKAVSELDPVLAEQYWTEFQDYAYAMWVNVGLLKIPSYAVLGAEVGAFTMNAHMSLNDAYAGIQHN